MSCTGRPMRLFLLYYGIGVQKNGRLCIKSCILCITLDVAGKILYNYCIVMKEKENKP